MYNCNCPICKATLAKKLYNLTEAKPEPMPSTSTSEKDANAD
jgi:hypothetical protein